MPKNLTLKTLVKFCKENGFTEMTMQMDNEIQLFNPDTGTVGGILEYYDSFRKVWIREFWSTHKGTIKQVVCLRRD